MKLIQLNIWYGNLLKHNVLPFLKREQPDILCLQEACSATGNKTPFFQGIEKIQEAVDLPNVYYSPVKGWEFMGMQIDFGNAILSRLPVEGIKTVFTRQPYKKNADFNEDHFNDFRNFQHATVTIEGKKINIINHHGHLVGTHRNGDAESTRQLDMIADYIDALSGPVIFTGDLNLGPEAVSLERLNKSMTNLCIKHKAVTTRNFTAWNAEEVCDYIFVNDDIKVDSFRVYDDVISDHQALGMEFTL